MMSRIQQLGELTLITKDIHDGPAIRYKFTDAAGEIGFISPVSEHFCRECNRLRLTADGHLLTCLLSDIYEDIKTPIRSGRLDEDLANVFIKAVNQKPLQRPADISPLTQPEQMISIGG
jgi:cyclic pyranopterin phosphate synthase